MVPGCCKKTNKQTRLTLKTVHVLSPTTFQIGVSLFPVIHLSDQFISKAKKGCANFPQCLNNQVKRLHTV